MFTNKKIFGVLFITFLFLTTCGAQSGGKTLEIFPYRLRY